jgi:condensin complex subunit 3
LTTWSLVVRYVLFDESYGSQIVLDEFWANLTPETAFLARVFVDHGKATKDDVRLEAALPVVTALAFRLQESYNQLIEDMRAEEEERIIRDLSDEEKNKIEDERLDKEFIIGEILRMAVNLDYSDEIGRRKMFQLVRAYFSLRGGRWNNFVDFC